MLIASAPKLTRFWRLIAIEVITAFLVASLPMIVAYYTGGDKALEQVVLSLIPAALLGWWSFGLTVVALLINVLNWYLYKKTDISTKIWNFLSALADEVTPSVQALVRIIGAVGVTFVLIWWINDSQTFVWKTAKDFLLIGVLALIEAIIIRFVLDWQARKYPSAARRR